MTQTQSSDDKSLFRIMIATDNHLGFLENDQLRGDDSFTSFEEILKVSKSENVDFLLLGGDLFHHHNPTKKTIIRASNILQKHVYGQKEHKFDVFCYEPNFKNENLSIELPIFIIHGNHDDPSGFENFSSIDIFSNREVNYFGKVNNYEEFDLYPILFVKGNTKIALYGIGNIKDERLYLALQNKKVNFHRPEDYKNWFNILIVHQNRFKGHHTGKNKKNYLPESFIPSFFDLVVWGHEHESFTEPVYNNEVGFHVYQPGSSVVTSLIQAESKAKHIGVLEVSLDRFRIVPVKLDSVRPFIYQQFELRSVSHMITKQDDVEKIIEEKIEEMLEEAEKNQEEKDPDNINSFSLAKKILPLIRLKIEFSGYQITRTNFIVSKFAGRIANPGDVIQFYKKSDLFQVRKGNLNADMMDIEPHDDCHGIEDEMHDQDDELRKFVNQHISTYFVEHPQKKTYFNSDFFCDALEKSVNGQERRSLELFFKNFNDVTFNSVKFDQNAQMIKELAPLENPKKDFSHLMDDLINKEEVNTMILNNIKNKRLSMLGRNSNEGIGNNSNNFNTSNNISNLNNLNNLNNTGNLFQNNQNILRPSNRDSKANIPNQNNISSNAGIKLTKANDFKGEIRENRDKSNNMLIDNSHSESHSQVGRYLRSSQNTMVPTNPKKQSGSILDFIKRSSESHDSMISQAQDDKLFDGVGLDRIEEESDLMFTNNKKSNVENAKDNKKKRNFLIDDKNKNVKKKNNKLK